MSDPSNAAQSVSTNEESQTRGEGGDNAESDNSEHPSINNQFDVPIDERSTILHHSDNFVTRLPLNDGGDSDEFGATNIVEQILLFGCGLGSSLCCKLFFLSVLPFPYKPDGPSLI